MGINNKSLYKKITELSDIFSIRMGKKDWRNYDCCWIKRTNEINKEDVIIIVVRGSLIKRAEKAVNYICDTDYDIKIKI